MIKTQKNQRTRRPIVNRFEIMATSLQTLSVRKLAFGYLNAQTVCKPEYLDEVKALLSTTSNYIGCEEQFKALLPALTAHQNEDIKSLAHVFKKTNKIN